MVIAKGRSNKCLLISAHLFRGAPLLTLRTKVWNMVRHKLYTVLHSLHSKTLRASV